MNSQAETKILFAIITAVFFVAVYLTSMTPNLLEFLRSRPYYYAFRNTPVVSGSDVTQPPVAKERNCDYFSAGVLAETSTSDRSSDPCWWLGSGAYFKSDSKIGRTVQGTLPVGSLWRKKYAKANSQDTDVGFHPQNIFRLISRKKMTDASQEIKIRINKYNASPSVNRNMSNGVLLMAKYSDSDNLYYAGLRVDGQAVIKKKSGGHYVTLASKSFVTGEFYDLESNPILLPQKQWMGIKLTVKDNSDGTVSLDLYYDPDGNGEWRQLLSVRDSEELSGSPPLLGSGYGGIRSDFMDVEFTDYHSGAT